MAQRMPLRLWVSFAVGVLCMSVSGTLYSFNVFSDALKAQLNLTNSAANVIVTVGNLGLCFATPVGYVCDRFGPRLTALCGGILSGLGYALMWAAVEDYIPCNTAILCVFYFIVGQGAIFTYMCAFMNYRNFESHSRGKAVGALDCAFGLSAAIFAQIYGLSFGKGDKYDQDVGGYLLFLAITMMAVNLLAVFTLVIEEPASSEMLIDSEDLDDMASPVNGDRPPAKDQPKQSAWAILCSVDYLLLFVFFTLLQGSGLLFMNNAGYIVSALEKSNNLTVTLSTILSIFSSFSRLAVGALSDYWQTISRSGLMFLMSLLMPLGHLMLVFWMEETLIPAAILTGCSFGASWCLTPLIVNEQWGIPNFGFNWGTMIMASAIGPLLYQPVLSYEYNSHIVGDGNDCYGTGCYEITFISSVIGLVFSSTLAFVSAVRFRRPHQKF